MPYKIQLFYKNATKFIVKNSNQYRNSLFYNKNFIDRLKYKINV